MPVEPEICDLMNIVIPKIMNDWKYIAEALHYDLSIIKAIEVKGGGNPKNCCRELLEDWLMANNGAKAGPKTWSTLLNALKEINEISLDITEEIIARVTQLHVD